MKMVYFPRSYSSTTKRLDKVTHNDADENRVRVQEEERMDGQSVCHNGEWIRGVWATATEVRIDPSKVNGPGRDMWDAILARWNKETVDKGGLSSVG